MPDLCVVIVDPYSSGAMLADVLQSRRIKCVAVDSSPTLPSAMKSKFASEHFVEVIQHRGYLKPTLRAVRQHCPTHILAGFESGVELADWLATQLALPGNDPRYHASRRDKFSMTELVAARGLRIARQFCSDQIISILEWIHANLDWPVIVKPCRSVASDLVFRCLNQAEVRYACEQILSNCNILGERNSSVLIQEYLDGTEYAVDVVSLSGQKVNTAIWQYHRPTDTNDFTCYDAMSLLPYAGARQDALKQFAFSVMEALGIEFGPAHCEIMWVQDEPVFIEVGVRLSAGSNATLSRSCGGISQLDKTIQAIVDPDQFLATLDDVPSLKQFAANVFLHPPCPGTLVQTHYLEQIEALTTFHSLSVARTPGTELGRVAGLVTLVHPDPAAVQQDIHTVRALVRAGLFQIKPTSTRSSTP
ncbi:MAG: ATP-grasp domain-containing protein [Planctomycetales bacterium]|nr:ATP-grasp domain-containing protein [Planctomycetales bacterium]